MNRKFKYYALVWAILLVVFNVICFITPSEVAGMSKFRGAFWIGYVFITIAFIGQLFCASSAMKTDDNTKLFYNIPIISISYTGLILTVVFGSLCMAIPDFPNWLGIIICILIFAFTAISVIKAKVVADIVEGTDKRIKAQTLFIKSLIVDSENLIARATTSEAKDACKKVFEAVHYSDPMSNDALSGIERQITLKFNDFSNAVANGAENISNLADELVVLIDDRNRKCKLLK